MIAVLSFPERKKRMYDQYGHEGLNGNAAGGGPGGPGGFGGMGPGGMPHPGRFFHPGAARRGGPPGRHPEFEEADFGFPHFVFRDPEEVFREFFGGRDPFEDLLDRELIALSLRRYFVEHFVFLHTMLFI